MEKERESRRLRAPVLGLLLLGCIGCGPAGCGLLGSAARLQLLLPEPPAHWRATFGDPAWRLLYPGPGGELLKLDLPSGSRSVNVLAAKEACTPFVAYPLLPAGGETLPPAGGVDPPDRGGADRLPLTWRRGAVASLLLRLASQGGRLEALNVERLVREMEERGGEDPWRLDLDRIAAELAGGSFQVTAIGPAASRDVRLPVGQGSWFTESPFALPVAATDGILRLAGLPLGFHRLFEAGGTRRIDLFVTDSELLWMERVEGTEVRGPPHPGN